MNVSTTPSNHFLLPPRHSSTAPPNHSLLPPRHSYLFPTRTFPPRRLKPRHLSLCSPLSSNLLPPALGFLSGLSLFLSRFYSRPPHLGDWILFTSPTPFNRFVFLRCPSLSFSGLEDANDRLVEEERHFVTVNYSGRIVGRERVSEERFVEYRRVCVNTTDGGVVSIDWPANLELEEEFGFDTTLLLVPGTTQGSFEESVTVFVSDALRRGFFPVVMNPRGCAGSPLTTPRLFTAADSDDISTVIQFISKARPWTTLMAVGWGYGANMLTKYLAEAGETTCLTAATCIDNPFDLEEATRVAPHHNALDQKLTGGLVDILRSNKELFQGRDRGFDVDKALLSKSVRDFEKSISMVSYGFEEIEDFYSKSSTRNVVGNVKIPVLYIQHDDGSVPLFSIPRSMIEENPFTSLILCSSASSRIIPNDRDAASWCQNLALEWLAAVELGLLKGRHPLLRDVDVTFNPAKGLALLEGQPADKGANNLLDLRLPDAKKYSITSRDMVDIRNSAIGLQTRSTLGSNGHLEIEDGVQVKRGTLQHVDSTKEQLVEEQEANFEDTERGQVLQTTQVVMNILDATMPGTLSEEEKNKVLTAVGQGETLVKALQDAVPEDVRGKLMTSVSGILRAQNMGSKFEKLLGIRENFDASLGPKSSTQEKARIASGASDTPKDRHASDQLNLRDGHFDSNQTQKDKSDSETKLEQQPPEDSHKSTDLGHPEIINNQQGDSHTSNRKSTHDSGNNPESDAAIREKAVLRSDNSEKGEETSVKLNSTSHLERAGRSDEPATDEHKVELNDGTSQPETKTDSNIQKNEEKTVDSSIDKSKSQSSTEEAHQPVGTSSESLPMESNDNQKKENKTMQPVLDQNSSADSSPPAFNVVQALDALTGMDDSTQVAVNSVFGVIEDMLTNLEEEKEDEDKNDLTDNLNNSLPKKHVIGGQPFEQDESNEKNKSQMDAVNTEDPNLDRVSNIVNTQGYSYSDYQRKEGEVNDHLDGGDHLVGYAERHEDNFPLSVDPNLYRDYLWNKHFNKYLIAKMPHSKPLDVDTTTALLLDYFPEDGKWKLLEQSGNDGESTVDMQKGVKSNQVDPPKKVKNTNNYIEPAYIVLDTDKKQEPIREYNIAENFDETVDHRLKELMQFVKNIILDALRVEVGRKLSAAEMKKIKSDLAGDLEVVANAVALAIGRNRDDTWSLKDKGYSNGKASDKVGNLNGERIIKAISSVVQGTSHLRRVLPIGVIVGSSLAALRKYFDVVPRHNSDLSSFDKMKKPVAKGNVAVKDLDLRPPIPADQAVNLKNIEKKEGGKIDVKRMNNDNVMVGAFTAALGASTLLVQQQDPNQSEGIAESASKSFKQRSSHEKMAEKLDDSDKNQNNIVSSFAEKAMSVAGPVVPTKEDGEVDQDRLVVMLTDLGQKGGMLRLVGKIALLWGGIRGAMSLTDRLISFLRIAERPLHQRVIGFAGMVLVLWSPVVVPLIPAILQSWTTNTSSRFVEIVSIIGLYAAVMILVMLWGRRIREYEDPLEEYGLDLISLPKMQGFLRGMIGGVMLVLSIQTVNVMLGCASFCWPTHFPSFTLETMASIKAFTQMILMTVRGIITATGIVLVEELLFRSWLPEEIAADLGYDQGIIISGLAFSLFQRSLLALPGLWLLSLALAGFRQRGEGSLSTPIGLRAGIMVSSYVLQRGGFLRYKSNFPVWLTGTHPFQPFSGMVGLAFSLLMAIIFYPRQPLRKRRKLDE